MQTSVQPNQPDVIVDNEGSIMLFRPQTDAAKTWCAKNLPSDALRWCFSYVVEPRYAQNIVDGMLTDGLEVEF